MVALGLIQNYVVGWRLHRLTSQGNDEVALAAAPLHAGHGAADPIDPWVHFLRDSTLAAPVSVGVLLATSLIARSLLRKVQICNDSHAAHFAFSIGAGIAAALASVPSVAVHGWLFDEVLVDVSLGCHYLGVALVMLRYTFAISLLLVAFFGAPWAGDSSRLPAADVASGPHRQFARK